MAVMNICNNSSGWLTVWLEPLGEDRWLKPGENLLIRSDYSGSELAFSVDYWADADDKAAGIENVNVYIENGDFYAEVVDDAGNKIECGHQRPVEINEKWQTAQAKSIDTA